MILLVHGLSNLTRIQLKHMLFYASILDHAREDFDYAPHNNAQECNIRKLIFKMLGGGSSNQRMSRYIEIRQIIKECT